MIWKKEENSFQEESSDDERYFKELDIEVEKAIHGGTSLDEENNEKNNIEKDNALNHFQNANQIINAKNENNKETNQNNKIIFNKNKIEQNDNNSKEEEELKNLNINLQNSENNSKNINKSINNIIFPLNQPINGQINNTILNYINNQKNPFNNNFFPNQINIFQNKNNNPYIFNNNFNNNMNNSSFSFNTNYNFSSNINNNFKKFNFLDSNKFINKNKNNIYLQSPNLNNINQNNHFINNLEIKNFVNNNDHLIPKYSLYPQTQQNKEIQLFNNYNTINNNYSNNYYNIIIPIIQNKYNQFLVTNNESNLMINQLTDLSNANANKVNINNCSYYYNNNINNENNIFSNCYNNIRTVNNDKIKNKTNEELKNLILDLQNKKNIYNKIMNSISNNNDDNDKDFINSFNNKNINIINNFKESKKFNSNKAFNKLNPGKKGYSNKKKIFFPIPESEKEKNIINLMKIFQMEDTRTTLMIKNIPNKYTISSFLDEINQYFKDTYDVFYLPIDYTNKCNLGFAFINFVEPFHIILFYELYRGKKWKKFNSDKICELLYAKFQGKKQLISHFEKGKFFYLDSEDKRPLILPTPNPLPKIILPFYYLNLFIKLYPNISYKIINKNNSNSNSNNINSSLQQFFSINGNFNQN